jgi:aminoglycoside 6'-N-acetyltransferase
MTESLSLRPLAESDFEILARFLAEPHVARWWSPDKTVEQRLDDARRALAADHVEPLAVCRDGRLIGYLQIYRCDAHPSGFWADQPPGTRGIDLYIGDLACIGRGLGPRVIEAAVTRIFSDPETRRIIIDPDKNNTAAIRAYEKAGFRHERDLGITPWGDCVLMVLDRP